MRGRILMLLLFAANAHNFMWALGAVDEDKVTKHLNRMEMDQYMDVLELKSMIYKILQGNDKIAEGLKKVEKMEGMLELVKTQVQDNAFYIKLIHKCQQWPQSLNLNRSNFFSAEEKKFYLNNTYGNWSEARDWCAEMGMQMAILKSASQMDAVSNELKERNPDDYYYWLGASDVGQTPGQFRWMDGTLVDGTTWYDGKIYKSNSDWNETTCVNFHPAFAKLSDQRCSGEHHFLCQVPAALAACL